MRQAGLLRSRALCTFAAGLFMGWALPLTWAMGQDPSAERLGAAVEQLVAEAKELGHLKQPAVKPVFARPHAKLIGWGPELSVAALERMLKPFTGNSYRDTYIRWHLMWPVRRMLEAEFKKSRQTGQHRIPPDTGNRLVQLVKRMPPVPNLPYLTEFEYIPEEVAREYFRLINLTRVRIGYPPFERDYSGENALVHMPPTRQIEAKKILAQAKELENKFKTVRYKDNIAYNNRLKRMKVIIREFRGDLIYALMQTGEPAMLKLVTSEIGKQVAKRKRIGLDLMAYMYLAAFDGYLSLYPAEVLKDLSKHLTQQAKASVGYTVYPRGTKAPPPWVQPPQRSFSEYAFHMTQMLAEPEVIKVFLGLDDAASPPPAKQTRSGGFRPETLTIDQIRGAIQRAIDELYQPRTGEDKILPHYGLRGDHTLYSYFTSGVHDPGYQEIVHEIGNHALICWAMLASGQSYQDPRLFKRINWVLSSDVPFVYDRGMRLQMLAGLSYQRWRPWVRRDAAWLTSALSEQGNFGYDYFGGQNSDWGDHANGQYGALGLWGAQQAGLALSTEKIWGPIDTHWRQTQKKTKGGAAAGWAVGMFNRSEDDTSADDRPPFYRTVTGPMTAGGVATLTLTERYLYGPKLTKPGSAHKLPHLGKGLRWLDENFKLYDDSDTTADWFYYMWTIQRVGQATGYRTFNGIDWFRQVTAEMLNRQQSDGLWQDPSGKQGKLLSTGFALLYLSSALEPIAVAKIRFDGNWNNRPHDLWNFVDHASDRYEVPTTWQVADLSQPVYQLMDSPLLYLASDEGFELPGAEIDRLRQYINAGGMLVANPESASPQMTAAVYRLAERLFPDRPFKKVDKDHLFYNVHSALRPVVQMKAIDNGIRPLVVHFVRDIGAGLQANDPGTSESFAAISNLYLYAVGLNPKRVRLQSHYVVKHNASLLHAVKAARIRYDGQFDPEPGALLQLQAILANDHDVDFQVQTVSPSDLTDHQIAFLTTLGGGQLTDGEAASIRNWLESGGTLWLDAAGGSTEALNAAFAMLGKIMPDATPTPLFAHAPIISGRDLPKDAHNNRRIKYRYYLLREMAPSNTPRLQAVMIGQRPAIIFSSEDLTAGLAGLEHWGIFGYTVQSARNLVVNGVLSLLD